MTETTESEVRAGALRRQRAVERTRSAYDQALTERDAFFLTHSAEHGGDYSHSALGRMAGGLPSMTVGRAVLAAIRRLSPAENAARRSRGGAGEHRNRRVSAGQGGPADEATEQ